MTAARYIASFIAYGGGKALFVGLFKIGRTRPLTHAQYWRLPAYIELKKLGMTGFMGTRPSCLWFDLKLMDFYVSWKGKLVVNWPPPERSWWRRAHRNDIPVQAILEDSALDAAMEEWNELDRTWSEIGILPKRWQAKRSEWRRWRRYEKSGHGGNRLLRQHDPQNFRFTILELVSPNMEAGDIIRLEASWKERLHTRQPHGLNDN
jgi:hypothetical protein